MGEAPLWISCSAFLWKAIFKLSINQRQTLMYTPLCPWVFVALLCGPYFPSQTFVVSYSLHPLPLIGQRELLAGPFFTTQSGSTRFYKQIFTISCCATEIAIVWLWRLTFCSQIPFLGIDRCSRADQDNEESHLCSLSALTCLEIYKQVSDHISKCMSLFCGFHLWACVRSEAVTAQRLCLSFYENSSGQPPMTL